MKKITLILCICIAVSASAQNTVDCGTVTDYDGNTYNTVVLGSQCWMRENLYNTPKNSDSKLNQKKVKFAV